MIMRYGWVSQHPQVFLAMTGLRVSEFDELVDDVLPAYAAAEEARLERPGRERALGAGHLFALSMRDHLLLTVVWLRLYPTHEVLGYLFGVSDSTVWRVIQRVLPVLEQAGRDTMRMPDPGKKRRRTLDTLLQETPGLAVVIDTFEQRVQRPRTKDEADRWYSGKKKQHTLKSQVAVEEESGQVVDIADSVPGRTADIRLLADSQLLSRLPEGVGGIGDSAYQGIENLHPQGLEPPRARNPAASRAPPRTRPSTPPFPAAGLLLSIPLAACAAIRVSPRQTATIANATPRAWQQLWGWSIVRSLIGCLPDS